MSNQSWNNMIQRFAFFGIGAFAGVLLISTAVFDPTICEDANCKMQWISAMSGYVAAIGALAAALITVPYLTKQVKEAKRQTDFIVGDTSPTFRISRKGRLSFTIRCVNWNRRDFVIEDMIFSNLENEFAVNSFTALWDLDKAPNIHGVFHRQTIRGWEDRSQPPRSVKFHFELQKITHNSISELPTRVEVRGILADEANEPFREKFELQPWR